MDFLRDNNENSGKKHPIEQSTNDGDNKVARSAAVFGALELFALVFWMALAVAVIILAIKPWAGARDSQSKPAAPIPAREIIYQPQHWKVF